MHDCAPSPFVAGGGLEYVHAFVELVDVPPDDIQLRRLFLDLLELDEARVFLRDVDGLEIKVNKFQTKLLEILRDLFFAERRNLVEIRRDLKKADILLYHRFADVRVHRLQEYALEVIRDLKRREDFRCADNGFEELARLCHAKTKLFKCPHRNEHAILRVFQLNGPHCAPRRVEFGDEVDEPHLRLKRCIAAERQADELSEQRNVTRLEGDRAFLELVENDTAFDEERDLCRFDGQLRAKTQILRRKFPTNSSSFP